MENKKSQPKKSFFSSILSVFTGTRLREFSKKYGSIFILLIMVVIMSFSSPTFRTPENIINVIRQVSMNGIIALGMTLVIITAGIDLSVGSVVAVSSVICGAILSQRGDIPAVILAVGLSILSGFVFGLINGTLISVFTMFPFVVTLSTQLVYRGVAYLLSNAQSYLIDSEAFRFIGVGKIGPIPVPVIIFFVLIIISHYLLAHTPFGRYVYAVGGNPEAARASGVNVKKVTLLVYVLMAVFTAISGVIMSSRVNAGQPNLGMGYETDAIAASVIGGVSFTGGIGTIPGTVIGVLIIGVINNAMNLLKVSSFWQMIAKGVIILVAVLVDTKLNKREEVHIG